MGSFSFLSLQEFFFVVENRVLGFHLAAVDSGGGGARSELLLFTAEVRRP